MQRTLRRIGRLRTSAGRSRCACRSASTPAPSTSSSSETSHRELSSPARARADGRHGVGRRRGRDRAEPATARGSDPALARARRRRRRAPAARRPRRRASARRRSPDVAGLELERCLPLAIREHLLAAQVARPSTGTITAAFLEFTGTDAAARARGRRTRSPRRSTSACATVQQAARRTRSRSSRPTSASDGGKIMLIAGAPGAPATTRSGCSGRCARSSTTRAAMPLRIGVNSRPRLRRRLRAAVPAHLLGQGRRRQPRGAGDGRRPMPGQILATRGVLERSRTVFEIEALEPFLVKGKAAAGAGVQRRLAVGRDGGGARRPRSLVGRERELGTLVEALDSARDVAAAASSSSSASPGWASRGSSRRLRTPAEGLIVLVRASARSTSPRRRTSRSGTCSGGCSGSPTSRTDAAERSRGTRRDDRAAASSRGCRCSRSRSTSRCRRRPRSTSLRSSSGSRASRSAVDELLGTRAPRADAPRLRGRPLDGRGLGRPAPPPRRRIRMTGRG